MKGILYGITIFLGSLFALQGQEIRVQNENGDPLGFSHLRVLKEEGLLFVADQHGVFHLPGNMASGKVAISHIGYETFVLSYQAGESHKVTLKAKIYDLGDFEVNPMDEKVMVTNAFDVLKETMKTPSVTKAYYKALGFQKESGSEIYSADYFGVYLYKELVDRSKKQFEWFQNGLNGFVGEHNRQWHAESLEAPSKFDNFSQSYGFGAIIGMENYGYLNDLLFMVSDLKLKDLVVVEACSTGPYECYAYLTGDVDLIIQIHALEQRIAHIEAKKLPRPRQPNIFWSSQKHMEVEFAWDESDYFMSQVRWEDDMPNHKLKAELFFLEKNAAWDINWNKGKTSSFFDYTRSSYIPNYKSEKWKQMGLLSMLNQYSNENINVQKLKSIPSDPTSTEAGKSSRYYWLQFYDYLHAQGIRWGGLQTNGKSEVHIYNKVITVTEEHSDEDGMINVKFGLVNSTSKTVNIIKVNPHCSCTGFVLEDDLISPNDTTYLSLEVAFAQLKILKSTYATVKIDHKSKYLLARIRLKED